MAHGCLTTWRARGGGSSREIRLHSAGRPAVNMPTPWLSGRGGAWRRIEALLTGCQASIRREETRRRGEAGQRQASAPLCIAAQRAHCVHRAAQQAPGATCAPCARCVPSASRWDGQARRSGPACMATGISLPRRRRLTGGKRRRCIAILRARRVGGHAQTAPSQPPSSVPRRRPSVARAVMLI